MGGEINLGGVLQERVMCFILIAHCASQCPIVTPLMLHSFLALPRAS